MATYIPLQERDVQKIAAKYNLAITKYEPIAGGAANSSFLLQARGKKYILTIFDEKSWSDVINLGRLLLQLADYKFPTTRLFLSAKGNIATTYQNKPILLKTYIAGQVCQNLNDTILAEIGAAMARLHQVPAPDFLPDEHPYGRQIFSTVIGQNIDSDYETWLDRQVAYLHQHLPLPLPRGLIHGDLFYDNVLIECSKLCAMIDFEEACHYYQVFDLGMGIVGLCANDINVSLSKARSLLKGYQHVRLLDESEQEALQLFVEYAATATSFWRYWKYNFHTPVAEKGTTHWQMVRMADKLAAISKTKFREAIFC